MTDTTTLATDEQFIDLEIRIFPLDERVSGYPVEITLGDQQEFPRGVLSQDIVPWTSSGDPIADGKQLFDALFADDTLDDAWVEARGQAPQRRVRLRIDPNAAELHALPWELLQEKDGLISADADTPFSRYLPVSLPWGGEVKDRPIRVLVAISNPNDLEEKYELAPLDVALERETFKSVLEDVDPGELEIDFLEPPVTLERLEAALRQGIDGDKSSYHVLHYLGHGAFSKRRGQAALYLQDDEGNTQIVTDDLLVGMGARQKTRPRLVFLAACQSAVRSTADAFLGLGPKFIASGMPAVVAMQDFVSMETARKLSAIFYQRLTEHGMADLALNEARSTLLTAGRPDAAVPVLFMRLKSGQIWGGEADARGQVLGAKPRIFWSGLGKMIKQGKCTPILGPRIHERWLPTPAEIAQTWADEHDYPFNDRDNLTRVALYMASSQGPDFPRYELLDTLMEEFTKRVPQGMRPEEEYDTLTDLISAIGWQDLTADNPNEPHRVLASLNLPLYLTTNPDSFMVEALKAAGKEPAREFCPWNEMLYGSPSLFEDDPDYEPSSEEPLVYHFFGDDTEVDSLLVTEDDYLDYLVQISSEMERIPDYIWATLTDSSLMFLGYSLGDWEFRVLMRGLIATREQRHRFKHVGVQLELTGIKESDVADVQAFLQQYLQNANINIFWGSTAQFIAELREQRDD